MPTHRLPRPPRPGLVLRAAVAAACLLALDGARAALAQLEAPATGRIGPETYRLDEEQVVSEHD
ncbi:MAG: hypothetical protein WCH13_09050, partial [Deltaproteobacteria bacterium]